MDATPPDGTDLGKLTAARASVADALFQGPAGARTLVPHREVPETIDLLGIRPGAAAAVRGAPADPPGGEHRIVLGRDVAVGRTDTAKADGATFTGPAFAGRVLLDPFLEDDAKALQTADPEVAGWRVLRSLGHRTQDGLFDAVRARDAGLLSVGLGAWSATDAAGLPALLFKFKEIAPHEFDLFFRLHGLDVDQRPTDPTRFRLRKIAADGQLVDRAEGCGSPGLPRRPGSTRRRRWRSGPTGPRGSGWPRWSRAASGGPRPCCCSTGRGAASTPSSWRSPRSTPSRPSRTSCAFDPHRSSDLQGEVNLDAGAYLEAQQAAGVLSADTLSGAIIDLTGRPIGRPTPAPTPPTTRTPSTSRSTAKTRGAVRRPRAPVPPPPGARGRRGRRASTSRSPTGEREFTMR